LNGGIDPPFHAIGHQPDRPRCAGLSAPFAMNRPLKCLLGLLLALVSATASAAWTLGTDVTDFAWTDSDGRPLQLSALRGPLIVMTMAYTACRKVCGTTTLVLGDIQRRLDAMKIDAEFVVVSYDPANDGPAEWREYRTRRQLDRANWHFLTGNVVMTRKIARRLDLDFWTYHDHIVHDFRIVLFDAQWRALGEVDWDHIDRVDAVLARLSGISGSATPPNSTD
jgi:cytochrome oxidase Cu insertion factor (SCO1/SenC/PrrC family)